LNLIYGKNLWYSPSSQIIFFYITGYVSFGIWILFYLGTRLLYGLSISQTILKKLSDPTHFIFRFFWWVCPGISGWPNPCTPLLVDGLQKCVEVRVVLLKLISHNLFVSLCKDWFIQDSRASVSTYRDLNGYSLMRIVWYLCLLRWINMKFVPYPYPHRYPFSG